MKKYMYLFVIIVFAFLSCDKSDSTIPLSKDNKEGILTFSSNEELTSTLYSISLMSKEERLVWEKSKGFKSFGTICDDFYNSINYEDFSNIDEIKVFVETHKSMIQLVQDENGEISCETQDYDNLERYIMNKNRMYIIGNRVYRSFTEKRIVSCNLDFINELTNLKNFDETLKHPNINFEHKKYSKVNAESNSNDQYFERTEKKSIGSKNYRTIVRVEATTLFWSSLGLPGTISYAIWYRIRNQSQFIIWWNTNASTEYAPFYYQISNGTETFTGNLQNTLLGGGLSFTVIDDDIEDYIGSYPYHVPTQSTAYAYLVTFNGYVHSTFTNSNEISTTITVNLQYPY